MQKDQGCFETAVIGLEEWGAVGRICELFGVHMGGIARRCGVER
jgi:hypothetical protein